MASRKGCKACTMAVVVLSACELGPGCRIEVGNKTSLDRCCCGCCCCCCIKSFGTIARPSREAMLTPLVVSVSHKIVGLLCWACSCWNEFIARDAAASADYIAYCHFHQVEYLLALGM